MATINKLGTVAIPEETLTSKMVRIILPPRQYELLCAEGIVVGLDDTVYPTGSLVKMYMVAGDDFNNVANILHYDPTQVSIEIVDEFELFCRVDYKVTWLRSYADGRGETVGKTMQDRINEELDLLPTILQQNIWFFSAHSDEYVPTVSSCPHFMLSTYSCGRVRRGGDSLVDVYGVNIPRDGSRDGRWPATHERAELDLLVDSSGNEYGHITDSHMCIWFDLPHGESLDHSTVVSGIVDTIREMYGNPSGMEEKRLELFREKLSHHLRNVPKEKLESLKNNYENNIKYLKDAEDTLRHRQKLLLDSDFEYRTFKNADESLFDVNAAVDEVIDLVDKSVEFGKFYIDGRDWLVVETNDIWITHPDNDEEYFLGRFAIKINPTTGNVHLPYAEKPPMRYDTAMTHPHVGSYNDVCWGNIGGTVGKLVDTGEYVQAIHLIANYLRHVNGHIDELEETWYTRDELEVKGHKFTTSS